jgi:hypothetical protein
MVKVPNGSPAVGETLPLACVEAAMNGALQIVRPAPGGVTG